MLTLIVILVVVAMVAAVIVAFGGFGPRVIRRTTVIDRRPDRTLETPVHRRRVVEEETLDRPL